MENSVENEIMYLKLDDIIPNRFQPREVFDEGALNELADSIRQHGVIQPIVVRQVDNKYEIIAGERRYKASALAGLTKIPAIIKNLDDKQSSIVAYIENAQRRDVSAIEEARTSERILKTNNMTQEQLAHELGISQSSLANKLRLLSLPMEVQEALMKNEISERHARSLLSVKEPMKQIELLDKIKTNKMTVRELDGEIRNMYGNAENSSSNQFIPGNEINNNFNSSMSNFNQPIISTFDNNMVTNDTFMNSNMNLDEPVVDVNPSYSEDSNSFLNFASNFDPSKYEKGYVDNNDNLTVNNSPVPSVESSGNFLDFINSYDNNYPNVVPSNNVIEDINIDANSSIQQPNLNNTSGMIENVNSAMNNDNASNFGNGSYNTSAPIQNTNDDFLNYLNSYDNNASVIQEPPVNYDVPKETVNNPVINNVVPPITSNFGDSNINYVENDARYHDVSKPAMFNSVDEVINELKIHVDNIKNNSNVKIDTDEINFDDVYQVTIKIDKRDIL